MERRTLLGGLGSVAGGLLAGCLDDPSSDDSGNERTEGKGPDTGGEETDSSDDYILLVDGRIPDGVPEGASVLPSDEELIADVELFDELFTRMVPCDVGEVSATGVTESPPDSDAGTRAHEAMAELTGREPPVWNHPVYVDHQGCTIRIELAKMHEDG